VARRQKEKRPERRDTMCECDSSGEKSMPMTSLVTFWGWWRWFVCCELALGIDTLRQPAARDHPSGAPAFCPLWPPAANELDTGHLVLFSRLQQKSVQAPPSHTREDNPPFRRCCCWSPRFCCWRRVLCSRPTSSPTHSLSASTATTANKWPTMSPRGPDSRVGAR
jgi:hypothetical protein